MSEEILTADLLESLLNAKSPEEYLCHDENIMDRSLPDYLYQLLEERGVKRADVIRASSLNSTVVYDIFEGKSHPGRDNAIMLAFGLRCSLIETQRLLRLAGDQAADGCAQRLDEIARDALVDQRVYGGCGGICQQEVFDEARDAAVQVEKRFVVQSVPACTAEQRQQALDCDPDPHALVFICKFERHLLFGIADKRRQGIFFRARKRIAERLVDQYVEALATTAHDV